MSGNSDHTLERIEPKPVHIPGKGELRMDIVTSLGTITALLFEYQVPKTVMNYLGLMTGEVTGNPYYDGLSIFRVVPDYVIHMGCPNGDGTGGLDYATHEEASAEQTHDRAGLLTQNYMNRDIGGNQFLITCGPAQWMDRNHTVFGEVIAGLDIVQSISKMPAKSQRPLEPVIMEKVHAYRT